MTARGLDQDLTVHACKQLGAPARRHVRQSMGPACAAHAAIHELASSRGSRKLCSANISTRTMNRGAAMTKSEGSRSMSRLTYGDFTKTGYQDCGNVFNVSDHYDAWRRLGKPRGTGAAAKVVREAWGDDAAMYEDWLNQVDVDEILQDGLELQQTYQTWRDAWQDCAESAVKNRLKGWIAIDEEDADL